MQNANESKGTVAGQGWPGEGGAGSGPEKGAHFLKRYEEFQEQCCGDYFSLKPACFTSCFVESLVFSREQPQAKTVHCFLCGRCSTGEFLRMNS